MVDESNVFYLIVDFVGRVFGLSIHEDLPFQTIEKQSVDKKIWKIMELWGEEKWKIIWKDTVDVCFMTHQTVEQNTEISYPLLNKVLCMLRLLEDHTMTSRFL